MLAHTDPHARVTAPDPKRRRQSGDRPALGVIAHHRTYSHVV